MTEEIKSALDQSLEQFEIIKTDTPLGLGGNKLAARRARVALNKLKKLCLDLRKDLAAVVSKKKSE